MCSFAVTELLQRTLKRVLLKDRFLYKVPV